MYAQKARNNFKRVMSYERYDNSKITTPFDSLFTLIVL